ncbi:MAG: NnrS family protein [Magnetovibrio sp.]|nr:NnrS family protein [Magnetovibrio sp.]
MSPNPTIQIEDPFAKKPKPVAKFALFSYGFRPFFLLAGVLGALSVPMWVGLFAGHVDMGLVASPVLWHGHEMLFGYAVVAIAGFLLTVVPNWTDAKVSKGPVLIILTVLWLLGRVAFWAQGVLPYGLVIAADLLFLIGLISVVIRPLINPQYRRQLAFVVILMILLIANVMTHMGVLGLETFDLDWGAHGLSLGLDAVILLITILGGRVIPSFTSSYLGHGNPNIRVLQRPKLDRAVILATCSLLVVDQVLPGTAVAGAVALIAAILHGARLTGWQGHRTLGNPIVWVLHLGYVWLVVGLALKGLGDFALIPASDALHALTIGAVGTITLGVMTRAALGHTGRGIKAAPLIVASYVLVSISALLRLAVPLLSDLSAELVMASGLAWTLAYVAFVIVYAPILILARIDGRPG